MDPASDRLLVSSSPPYDFQADLPGENPHVNKRGAVLEIDEVREASKYRHAVRVRCPGLTRPGGLAVAPPKHPKAGQVFVTEYGSEGRSGRVLALDGGGASRAAESISLRALRVAPSRCPRAARPSTSTSRTCPATRARRKIW